MVKGMKETSREDTDESGDTELCQSFKKALLRSQTQKDALQDKLKGKLSQQRQ